MVRRITTPVGHVREDRVDMSENGIGERVRASRERRGWSREALAFHAGLSWSAIAQLETGRRRNLRPATLAALAKALGLTVDYLVTGRAQTPLMLEHRALLYADEHELAAGVVPFLEDGIERGEPTLAVTRPEHLELLREELGELSEQVELVDQAAWYRAPESTLERVLAFVESAVGGGASWVRIVGEVVWDTGEGDQVRPWARYESLLNLTLATAPATIVCPYDTRTLGPEIIELARATHPHLIDHDVLSTSPTYAPPSGFLLEES
jgi:transcriptional regulator with XRE-family HTH domain